MRKVIGSIILLTICLTSFGQDVVFWGSAVPDEFYSLDVATNTVNTIATNQDRITRVRIDQNLEQVFWSCQFLNKIQKTKASVSLAPTNISDVKTNLSGVSTITVDATENLLFYSLSSANAIFQTDTNGVGTNTFINTPGVTAILGMFIDYENDLFYWSERRNSTNSIKRADLSTGGNVSTIYSTSELLFDIVYIPEDSSIYFTNRTGNKLQKIKTDGTGLQTLITESNTTGIGTLTGDYCTDVIYYVVNKPVVGGNGSQIKKTDFSGSNPTVVIDTSYSFLAEVDALFEFNIGKRKDFLGPDQSTCEDSITLNAKVRGGTYLWNDNSTASNFTVKQTGNYSVTVTSGNCTKVDSIQITFNQVSQPNLGPDTAICIGDSIIIGAPQPGAIYSWSDNSTNSTLNVNQAGIYWVDVTVNGCTLRDSIIISNAPIIQVDLGNDSVLTQGDSITLGSFAAGASYLWSTGATSDSVTLKETGIYWLDVTVSGCTYRDSISLVFIPPNTTSISGIINSYSKVTGVFNDLCVDSISVVDGSLFTVGEQVLIIQMQDANADTSTNSSFGDVNNVNATGLFELNTVTRISGNFITLQDKLVNSYSPSTSLQLVTYPSFSNAVIFDILTAQAWNGETGGILAFEVTDSLYLLNDINTDGKGFRGGRSFFGNYNQTSSDCGKTALFAPPGLRNGAQKGEGIAILDSNKFYGRGHFSNGGGGGNSHNSGGAGGANAGVGGDGGNEWSNCGSSVVGGIGGEAFNYGTFQNRVIMGGGGGGGESNGNNGSDGGNGGAIIIISASNVIGFNNSISSRGDSAEIATSDGAGGGGAGGSIVLSVNNFTTPLNIIVDGGKGGDNVNPSSCVGPGGGGGSGIIKNLISLTPNVSTSINLGERGIINSSTSACAFSNYGSTGGQSGIDLQNIPNLLTRSGGSNAINSTLGADTTICFGDSIILDASFPNATYLWSNNSTNASISVKQSGIFWVDITTQNCFVRDSIQITVNPDFTTNLGSDTTLCFGDSILLDAFLPNATYLWSDNSIDTTVNVKQSGIYWVDATINGCTKRDSVSINFFNEIQLDLGSDTSVCVDDSVRFDLTFPGATYQWSDGSIDSSFTIKSDGKYFVTVTEFNGCSAIDSISVSLISSTLLNLGEDTTLCEGESILLSVPSTFSNTVWSDNSTNQTLLVTTPGVYFVDADFIDCTVRDSIVINFASNIGTNFFGNDTVICNGDSINFDFGMFPNQTFLWNDSTILPTNSFDSASLYWLEISEGSCTSRDTFNLTIKESPLVDLGPDTSICIGEPLVSNYINPNANYLWSSGSIDTSISINSSGVYWLETLLDGCIDRDSITVTVKPKPIVDLGLDTTLCLSDTLKFFKPSFNSFFLWSDSTTLPSFEVTKPGLYWLEVTFQECSARDSIVIEYFDSLGSSFLAPTYSICPPETEKVDLPLVNSSYLWQNGSTSRNYTFQDSGLYFVQISNTCGTRTDSTTVNELCPCEPIVPSVFTPNNDQINDQLSINLDCEIDNFSMEIFTRWGEKVFGSAQPNFVWDGTVKGKTANEGTYFYVVKWKLKDEPLTLKKGSFLLTR